MRRIAAIVLTLTAAACATDQTSPQRARSTSNFHGAFCGADYPPVSGTTREVLAELKSRPASDDIDSACKRHDICYVAYGMHSAACDFALIDELDALKFSKDVKCKRLSIVISSTFVALPVKYHPESEFRSFIYSAIGVIGVAAAPPGLLMLSGDLPTTKCTSDIPFKLEEFDSKNLGKLPQISVEANAALSLAQRCEREMTAAYNVASLRNQDGRRADVDRIASAESATVQIPISEFTAISETVFQFPSLNNYSQATIQYLRCMRRSQPSPMREMRPIADVREKIENCQYIESLKPFQICVTNVLLGKP